MSKKVISMSLWGTKDMYTVGAVKNARITKDILPEWEMWVYHNDSVPNYILKELNDLDCKLINSRTIHSDNSSCNMFWRFYPAGNREIERFIVRDADSRLSLRDVSALEDWEASDKKFHIVREHPEGHVWSMCGGMWGSVGGAVPHMEQLIADYINGRDPNQIGIDQFFLAEVIYPNYAQQSSFVHDEYTSIREPHAVPIKRDLKLDNFAFIGEAMEANDTDRFTGHRGEQRETIQRYYEAKHGV